MRSGEATRVRRLFIACCSALAALTAWESVSILTKNVLIASPAKVLVALWALLASPDLYEHFLSSIARVVEGYALSAILALPLAFVCERYQRVSQTLLPSHDFIRYIPVPAFVPLCAVFFGVGDLTKVSLIFLGTYFQLLFMFIADIQSIPPEIIDSARCLGLSGIRLWRKVLLRAALPRLLESARIGFAWSWSYLLVAEVVNARRGIGYLVLQAYRVLAMDRLFALLFLIGIYGMLSDALFRRVIARVCPWVRRGQYVT